MDLTVTFIVVDSGVTVHKRFDSYYRCRNFVNKLRYSQKCRLVSYPNFSE